MYLLTVHIGCRVVSHKLAQLFPRVLGKPQKALLQDQSQRAELCRSLHIHGGKKSPVARGRPLQTPVA